MNEKNPNNRRKQVLTYHCQWLYGHSALRTNLMIMQRLKIAFSKRKLNGTYGKSKKEFINHFLEKSLNNAIQWAALQDLHNEKGFSVSQTFEFEGFNKVGEDLKNEDNNNGFFICEIDKNLNIKYAFVSGLEDTETHQVKTPKEYFRLFYTEKQYNELTIKDHKVLTDLEKFRVINHEDTKSLTETMNLLIKPMLY